MTYNTLGLFITKFQVTADELAQERTQLRCYEDTLLTGNCHKICQIKKQNKQTNKPRLEKPVQEKSCQIVCLVVKINNKKHVIVKKFDNEKITEKITRKFSIYYRCFLFRGYLHY